jgi:hypothetical protein
MRLICAAFIVSFLWTGVTYGQDTVYVNTDNLVMRDRPERVYNVFAILRPACPLKLDATDVGHVNNKSVNARFYQVILRYKDIKGVSSYMHGWVDKRYVVTKLDKVNYPGADKTPGTDITELMLTVDLPYGDNEFNGALYPPPKFKGAEKPPPPPKRVYHIGPRGGCFYKDVRGKKVYVDKQFCKGVK